MVKLYVQLILQGKRSFTEVPDNIKEEVRSVLVEMDCIELTKD